MSDGPRKYAVEVTTRETFTVIVKAATAKEAARKARVTGEDLVDDYSHGDRTITGTRRVYRVEDDD